MSSVDTAAVRAARARRSGRTLDIVFDISIIIKGLDGAAELLAGVLLLFVSPAALNSMAQAFFQHELTQDPDDFVANHVLNLTAGLSSSATLFAAIYLAAHGLVKVVLVWAVLRDKLWAFPWMIAFLLAFIGYQTYQMTQSFTVGLLALTLFDVFVTWLTVLEYRKRRIRRDHAHRNRDGHETPA